MKSPSLHPEIGRVFGINWQAADEISVAYGQWRDASGGRPKNHVLLRLANGESETGHNMSMSRCRARQIAIALYEASGRRWPFSQTPRRLPNRLLQQTRVVMTHEIGLGFAMTELIQAAARIIDQEIEDRKHSGNAEYWQDLQIWSDHAHAVLRQIGGAA
jgi:hypothetical protein